MTESDVQNVTVPAADGFSLAATLFRPAAAADRGAAVLIAPATGVKRDYYGRFARHLAANGFAVLTIDYRGIGGSAVGRAQGRSLRMQHWGERDMAGAIAWLDANLAPRRMLLVGHSVAGQVLALAPNGARLDAALFVASQAGGWINWDGFERLRVFAGAHALIPAATALFGRLPGWIMGGEDLPKGIAFQWARWIRCPDYLLGELPEAREGYRRLRMPIRFYSFSDDERFGPRRAVETLIGWYSSARGEHRRVAPQDVGASAIGHFGFFRDRFADTLWRDAVDWLAAQAAADPAPARAVGRS